MNNEDAFIWHNVPETINKLHLEIAKREDIINKAIEYIDKHKINLNGLFDEPDCPYWLATNPDELLDILKGSDKE